MSFSSVLFTSKGRILQAKAETGIQLQFTKIGIGKGSLGGTPISEVSDLIESVMNVNITSLSSGSNGQAKVSGVFQNGGLSEGFYWREIGLYANDPDAGEILYCYGNAGDLAEYIPAGSGNEILEKHVSIVALIGNAENISANIDSSLVHATVQDLEKKVDKVDGKGLSTEDFTTQDKNNLAKATSDLPNLIKLSAGEPSNYNVNTLWLQDVGEVNFSVGGGINIANAQTSAQPPSDDSYWFEPI